jgi:hypothetical protein
LAKTFPGLSPPQIIPTTEAPSQIINVTLNNQACRINLYTKSVNMPRHDPNEIVTDPPRYQNENPVYMDLLVNDVVIIGGVKCRESALILMDTYLGFVGDFSVIDVTGNHQDPQGVSVRLPPTDLMNDFQLSLPITLNGRAPPAIAGKIPGMGTRWLLTYWPNLR